jgi:hypothetical protein
MQTLTDKQFQCLKRITWDYNIPVEDMFAVIIGRESKAGHWNRDQIFLRMLEKLSWYDLLEFFTPEEIAGKLSPALLSNIHNVEKRAKYEHLGKILRGEPVSFTKWGPQFRKLCQDSLLSHRWNSA